MPYDPCDRRTGQVSSLHLVRYRGNDYSVPVACGHRDVVIRGYVDTVVVACGGEEIARHRRSYDMDYVFDPLHYLPLLEHKVGALDQAAPLLGWDLLDNFATLRRLLERRMGKAGKREYVQVLRLETLCESVSKLDPYRISVKALKKNVKTSGPEDSVGVQS